jgi:hypothetical protein
MNHSRNNCQSPLAPFPGQRAPRLYNRGVEAPRGRPWHFVTTPTGKGFMRVRPDNSWGPLLRQT